jgi:hypothetical protein
MFNREIQTVLVLTLLLFRGVAGQSLYIHCNPAAKWEEEGTCYFGSLPTFQAIKKGAAPKGFLSELAVYPGGVNELLIFKFSPQDLLNKARMTMKEAFTYERLDLNSFAKGPKGVTRDFSRCSSFLPDNSVQPPVDYERFGIMNTKLFPFVTTFPKGEAKDATPFPNVLVCNMDMDKVQTKAQLIGFCPDNPVLAYTFPVDPKDSERGYLSVPFVKDCYKSPDEKLFRSAGYAGLRLISKVNEADFTEPGRFLIVHSDDSRAYKDEEQPSGSHTQNQNFQSIRAFSGVTFQATTKAVLMFAPTSVKQSTPEKNEYKIIITPPEELSTKKKFVL